MSTIVWICDQDHLRHPFILQAVSAACEAKFSVTVVDRAVSRAGLTYRHLRVPFARASVKVFGIPIRGSAKVSMLLGWPLLFLRAFFTPAQLYVAELPSTAFIAWLTARFHGAKILYHPYELFGDQTTRVSPFTKWLERWLLSNVIDGLVTQNSFRANVYSIERNCRVTPVIVRNTKSVRPCSSQGGIRTALSLSADTRIVLYEGYLIPGRWLKQLVESMNYPHCIDVHLVFVGERTIWWRKYIEPVIDELNLTDRVHMLPYIQHSKLCEFIADADAGVIIYDNSCRNNIYCAPGKLSDYVSARLPIICPAHPPLVEFIDQYKIGVAFQDNRPEEIAQAISAIFAEPREIWRKRLELAEQEYNWSVDQAVLVNQFKELCQETHSG
ncbi:MAG: glycosyltransferase [Sulfurimonas sp.]|nr:glycosyltransferase [Sulfurimonas sp.]